MLESVILTEPETHRPRMRQQQEHQECPHRRHILREVDHVDLLHLRIVQLPETMYLATNLHELGVPDKVIQAILRHEDVKTTQRSYIKTVPRVVTEAMKRLEEKIACAADVQQVSVN